MKTQRFVDIYTDELAHDAIIHDSYTGFREDYLMLHCLLRIYKPNSVFEIGTNIGTGTNIICNAVPNAKVYSLDLDYETMRLNSAQYPLEENGDDRVGSAAKFEYTQLRGDSLKFDYSKYVIDAFYIDGEHDYKHPYYESRQAILNGAKLIIWHDSDMQEVYSGIIDAFDMPRGENYELYRITDTRIAYAVKK